MVMRLVPSPAGCVVRTAHGVLHLPGLRLDLGPARIAGRTADAAMAELTAARGVAPSDLGSYQHAVRLVLTNDLITASRPRAGALATVLRWADLMARDFAALLGYTLIATAHQVRLVRRLDTVDDTQRSVFAARSGRPVRPAPARLPVPGPGRLPALTDRDQPGRPGPRVRARPPTRSTGSASTRPSPSTNGPSWTCSTGWPITGRSGCPTGRPRTGRGTPTGATPSTTSTTTSAPPCSARPGRSSTCPARLGCLTLPDISAKRSTQREAAARRARRLLLEHPVAYYATLDGETAAALRSTDLADNLARLTGLVVERRAEGVLLADPTGSFTDQRFPGRGGAVNRTAGLLLAKVADLLEDPDDGPALTRLPVPTADDDQRALLDRIDAGRPAGWPATDQADPARAPSWPGDRRARRRCRAGPGPRRCRLRSSSGPGWRACSTTCTPTSARPRSPRSGSTTRRGCWPRRCGSWMTCGSSAACPAAR